MNDLGRLIDALEIPGSAKPPESLLAAAHEVTGGRENHHPRDWRRLLTSGRPTSPRRPILLAAITAIVALILFGTLTGPGRAVAEQIGKLVGIGEDSTIDHATDNHTPASGRGVVIATGTVPDGPAYEIVAYANHPPKDERKFVGGSEVATCLSIDFPAIEKQGEFNTTCFGEGEIADLHTSGSSDFGANSELGNAARYMVSGETSDAIASVEVTYEDAEGNRVEAPTAFGVADADVLDEVGAEYPGGEFLAFLPDDGASGGRQPATDSESILDSVEVTAMDSAGQIVASEDWGAQLKRDGVDLQRICNQVRSENPAHVPSICGTVSAEASEPPPTSGPGGDMASRIDLLWQGVIDRAEAGQLNADVDPAEVIHVMNMALDPSRDPQTANRQEGQVIAMVEKLRAAGDLPPLGTPLPPLGDGE